MSILIHLPPLYSVSTIHSFYNFEPNSLSFNLLCYSTALHRNTGLPSKDKTSDDPVRNFIGLFLALIFRSLFQLIKKTKINHKSVIRVIKVFFFVGNIQSLNLNLIYQVFIYSSSTALHRYSVVGDNINTIKTTFYLSFDC